MPPIDHELNLTTQAILTDVSWGLTAVLLLITIRMGVRERTPFYALMVLGALVGAFVTLMASAVSRATTNVDAQTGESVLARLFADSAPAIEPQPDEAEAPPQAP